MDEYYTITQGLEFQIDPADMSVGEAQQSAAEVVDRAIQQILTSERSGGPFLGAYSSGTPWEVASHTVSVIGRHLAGCGRIGSDGAIG